MKSIRLQNFQGYKDSTIEFSDTITAITGESDKGKSSIVRAIKLVKDNVPLGDTFVRNGTDTMSITIDKVSRVKTPKLNGYVVEGIEKPFKALRGDVPEVVQQSLNMSPDSIQNQHKDSIFLLDDSPGKVARKLSELSDLESTTKALKHISSKKLQANSDIKVLEKNIKNTKEQIQVLSKFQEIDKALTKIEQNRTAIDLLNETYDTLYTSHKNAVKAQIELNALPNTKALQPAQQLITDYANLKTLKDTRDSINTNIKTAIKLEKVIALDPSKLLKRTIRLQNLYTEAEIIKALIDNCKNINNELIQLEERHSTLLSQKITAFGKGCPLCGNTL